MMTIEVPLPSTWHICQIVVDCLTRVVTNGVLNQSRGHWLLSDAFHSTISMSLKSKEEPKNASSFHTLMEEDSNVSVTCVHLFGSQH